MGERCSTCQPLHAAGADFIAYDGKRVGQAVAKNRNHPLLGFANLKVLKIDSKSA